MKLEIRGAEKLSFREKQAVILKETGHSNEAIAKRMGVNTATVATLLSRARSKGYEVVIIISTTLGIYGAENEENEEEV
ncbi:MAG TPA: sigma-70 family RNA polymerase sigma factor [Syntrophaceticus sp.]|uniref:RNA polymerase, sigma-24 subunit, ECF subfamily n=1 Tax=Syntrophaceticus schinkii TaxID=499207 RepID=A0A0B7MIQ5_9FIRM|nr:sigma-70 region 4 domain-containing protein [Syntrophaceticus schinkii]HHY30068.1 sigma-70 family RNA polymerase sigma factor [Syntrophaceticus sp.]MDD2358904.1 sigma-70 region 4 domain-containing protein [Syntrophaceticus schinkii]MDD4261199.1 sigma-70 region 4 domain-containing protein [Syntrophaceticus schinkii]MDD4674092.1 sigma-70 region 4 domain-containing protein [Syntrophaceticus schinkii]CEO87532.1 RNA polymerase, sigma-24 subunit, ECF subfamily [Syntrophaceticus schinkii]